ncbi:MAG TPA: T9SS type A sorting domain-containing protein [Bacteroidales bacterium]|nr:T9SS type A sorting domain-containing protein [Bacteroidales bacterium]
MPEKRGVEVFTPWTWKNGMFEVLHLFTHFGKPYFIPGTSSDEEYVSVYPNINAAGDSITLFLVNRHLTDNNNIRIVMKNFPLGSGSYNMYSVSSLPANETFVSNSSNALTKSTVQAIHDTISVDLSPLSVTAIVLVKSENTNVNVHSLSAGAVLYPNPAETEVTISLPDDLSASFNIEVIDNNGRVISSTCYKNTGNNKKFETINLRGIASGIYWVRIVSGNILKTQKLIVY